MITITPIATKKGYLLNARKVVISTCCIVLICCCTGNSSYCQHVPAYDKKDIFALNDIANKWQRYWNTHDMDSMGTLLREDVDFINVAGVWLKSKALAVKDHKEKHLGARFKTSVWTTDSVVVKYVQPNVAVMHVGWGISGDFENDSIPRPPRHGIFTWVVSKQNNKWLLLAIQNTNIKEPVLPSK